MTENKPLHLFDATGVELEYMLVDAETLAVRPEVDEVFRLATGAVTGDAEFGAIGWSNELVLHVLELKTNGPARVLDGLAALFQENVREANRLAAQLGARLLPTAMHPLMDPATETRLWPHEYSPVYEAYNRIFDCRGHGWSNLQSTHINLPFCGDEEFGRLHAAIRLILPILPALAASSPLVEGVATGRLDNRLEFYRLNSHRIPCIAGAVVPEPVFTRGDYENDILQASYRAIASLDPEGILQDEFLNSRGAIARFGRGSIEIRVLDIQECPAADLAIVELVDATLRALTDGFWLGQAAQRSWPVAPLAELFISCLNTAENTPIPSAGYRALFGHEGDDLTAGELWQHLAQDLENAGRLAPNPARNVLLSNGTLSSRILAALPAKPRREDILALYGRLADHLEAGTMFHG